jgi:flagellar hook-associated protein 3 FlgL
MTRIASLAQHQALLAQLTSANAKMFKSEIQIATGKVAQEYKDIARDTGVLMSAKRVESRTEQYLRTTNDVLARVDMQDVQLSRVADAAGQLRQSILDSISLESGAAVFEELDSAFREAVSVMNARQDGRYMFAGTRTNQEPININSIQELVAAVSVADIYDNNSTKQSVEIGDGQSVEFGFLADEVSQDFFDVIKRMAEYHNGPNGPFTDDMTTAQKTYLESELANLKQMHEGINAQVSRNGLFYKELESARDQHETSLNVVRNFISGIEDADMAEVISRFTLEQIAAEAATRTLAELRSVSLLDFI